MPTSRSSVGMRWPNLPGVVAMGVSRRSTDWLWSCVIGWEQPGLGRHNGGGLNHSMPMLLRDVGVAAGRGHDAGGVDRRRFNGTYADAWLPRTLPGAKRTALTGPGIRIPTATGALTELGAKARAWFLDQARDSLGGGGGFAASAGDRRGGHRARSISDGSKHLAPHGRTRRSSHAGGWRCCPGISAGSPHAEPTVPSWGVVLYNRSRLAQRVEPAGNCGPAARFLFPRRPSR